MRIPVIIIAFALLMSLQSCIYAPLTADIPLIHKKNDFRFDGGISLPAPSLNSTISYGLTDKIAVQAYGRLETDQMHYYHGALGYYKNLEHRLLLETYGGLGYGNIDYSNHATGGSREGDFHLPFVQVNLGRLASESSNFEFGLGLKTGILDAGMTRRTFDGINPNYDYRGLLFEPTLFLRPGGKRVKANFKISGCWIEKLDKRETSFPYSKFNFGISLNLR